MLELRAVVHVRERVLAQLEEVVVVTGVVQVVAQPRQHQRRCLRTERCYFPVRPTRPRSALGDAAFTSTKLK